MKTKFLQISKGHTIQLHIFEKKESILNSNGYMLSTVLGGAIHYSKAIYLAIGLGSVSQPFENPEVAVRELSQLE